MRDFLSKPRTHLIFAADMATYDDNIGVLDKIADYVDVVKICNPLVYSEGVGCIRKLKKRYGKPIFADLKVADVPHTSASIVQILRRNGADVVMVHGFIGIDGIQQCIRAAGDEVGIIIQVELTNPGGVLFSQPIADDIAEMVADMPVYGLQAPGNRPDRIERIRSIVGDKKKIVCCGVGAQGGDFQAVLRAGGDYPIVGRMIYESPDPRATVETLLCKLST